jgi:hypothetical protein
MTAGCGALAACCWQCAACGPHYLLFILRAREGGASADLLQVTWPLRLPALHPSALECGVGAVVGYSVTCRCIQGSRLSARPHMGLRRCRWCRCRRLLGGLEFAPWSWTKCREWGESAVRHSHVASSSHRRVASLQVSPLAFCRSASAALAEHQRPALSMILQAGRGACRWQHTTLQPQLQWWRWGQGGGGWGGQCAHRARGGGGARWGGLAMAR